MQIQFPAGGGAEIDGKKVSEKQLGSLVHELVRQGLLPRYALGTAGKPWTREVLERLGAGIEEKDGGVVLAAHGELLPAVRESLGVVAEPTVTTARVPTAEDVPGVMRKAGRLVRDFPLQTLPAHRDPAAVEAQAGGIEAQIAYEGQLQAEAQVVQRNIVARTQDADAWLRNVWQLCQAAAPTTPGLGEAIAFLSSYFGEAAERAQVTRQLVDRVRSETAEETKDAVYRQARTEAKEELRDQLDERFRALLDK